ncbi:preprotein translocase subunit SecE [uncultured Paludibaculum sp.]|uniref:preprotein translocase subunit SecE n=1 Tax=uncultured Paludibaculum sp. TaxID=1765020 RepID=UPI002AABD179|nr:preprotein translocase subunit SecE [uncultured Paludibaculum sp.]
MAAVTTAANGDNQPNQSQSGISGWFEQVKEYISDLKAEMRRVSWPSKTQVQATTAVVIAAVFLFAAYFAVVDLLLGRAINQIFQALARR